jgi:DNA-binding LacI/PurR family transcriptional regulator
MLPIPRIGLFFGPSSAHSWWKKLHGQGSILAVGGLCLPGRDDDGHSRVAGFQNALALYPAIRFQHIPAQWSYDEAYAQVYAALSAINSIPDAIFGLSDTLALAACDAARTLSLIDSHTLIVGVNGDPLARPFRARDSAQSRPTHPLQRRL